MSPSGGFHLTAIKKGKNVKNKQNDVPAQEESNSSFTPLLDDVPEKDRIYAERILSLPETDVEIAMLYWYMDVNILDVARSIKISRLMVCIRIIQIRKKVFPVINGDKKLSLEEERKITRRAMDSVFSWTQEDPWLAKRVINISRHETSKPTFALGIEAYILISLLFFSALCMIFYRHFIL